MTLSHNLFRSSALLLILVLLLAGCGVENLDGVTLATIDTPPTTTPVPTATPDPLAVELPQTAEKEFLGTTIVFSYPDEWMADESGQSLTVFDPEYLSEDFEVNGPGVGAFIQLLSRLNVDAEDEAAAPVTLVRFLREGAAFGFVPEDSVPNGPEEPLAFDWGGLQAAVDTWQSEDGGITGANVVVIDGGGRRFVIISSYMETALWQTFEPTWIAMMSTFTLDGDALPGADFQAAYALAAGQ